MEKNKLYDQELLSLFTNLIEDDVEKEIFKIIFTNDDDIMISELINQLENFEHDKD
jgi:hypothetical protein